MLSTDTLCPSFTYRSEATYTVHTEHGLFNYYLPYTMSPVKSLFTLATIVVEELGNSDDNKNGSIQRTPLSRMTAVCTT